MTGLAKELEALPADVEAHLDIATLNVALASRAGRFSWWAAQEVEARHRMREVQRAVDDIETEIKDTESQLYLEFTNLTPKPTVDAIKAMVQVDPRRARLVALRREKQTLADRALRQADLMKVGRETMRDRKDDLLELARNIRDELWGGTQGAVRESRMDTPKVEAAKRKAQELIDRKRRK